MLFDSVVCSEQRQRMLARKGQVVKEGVCSRLGRVELHSAIDAVVEHGVPTDVYEAVDLPSLELSEIFDPVMLDYLLHQR